MDITIKSYCDLESDAQNEKCNPEQIPEILISRLEKLENIENHFHFQLGLVGPDHFHFHFNF